MFRRNLPLSASAYKIFRTSYKDVESLPDYKPGVKPNLFTIVPREFAELASVLDTDEFTPQEWAKDWAYSTPPGQSIPIRRQGNVNSVWVTLGVANGLQLLPDQSCAIPMLEKVERAANAPAMLKSSKSRLQLLAEGMVMVDQKVCLLHVSLLSYHDLPMGLHHVCQKGKDPSFCRYNAVTGEFMTPRIQTMNAGSEKNLPAIPKVLCKDPPNRGGRIIGDPHPYQSLWVPKRFIDKNNLKLIDGLDWTPDPGEEKRNRLKVQQKEREKHGPECLGMELKPLPHETRSRRDRRQKPEQKNQVPGNCFLPDRKDNADVYYHLSHIEEGYKILADLTTKTHLHPLMSSLMIQGQIKGVNPHDGMAVEVRHSYDGKECQSLIVPDLLPRLEELAKEKGYRGHHWEVMSEREVAQQAAEADGDTAAAAEAAAKILPTHKIECYWGSRVETVFARSDPDRMKKRVRKNKKGDSDAASAIELEVEEEETEDPMVRQKRVDLVVRAAGDRAHHCAWPHLLKKVYTVEFPHPNNSELLKACDALKDDLALQQQNAKIPFKLLGCDLEWACEHWSRKGRESRTALLQVCSGDVVVMIRTCNYRPLFMAKNNLEASAHFPEPLKRILMDPTVVKVGVGIMGDREKLFRDCGVLMNPVLETDVAADVYLPDHMKPKGASLKKITLSILDVELAKSKRVTLSNWANRNQKLTKPQIEYASDDARASYLATKKILEDGFQYIKETGGKGVYDEGGLTDKEREAEDAWQAEDRRESDEANEMVKLVDDLTATEVFKRKFADLSRVFETDPKTFQFESEAGKGQGKTREPAMLKLMGSVGAQLTNAIASSSPFFASTSANNSAAVVAADEFAENAKSLVTFSYVETFGVLTGTVLVNPVGQGSLAGTTTGIVNTVPITLETVVGPEQVLRGVLKLSFRLHHALNRRLELNEKLMDLYRDKKLAEDEDEMNAQEADFLNDDEEELPSFMVASGLGRKNFSLRSRIKRREERDAAYDLQVKEVQAQARASGSEEKPSRKELENLAQSFTPMALNFRRARNPIDFLDSLIPCLFPEAQQLEFTSLNEEVPISSGGGSSSPADKKKDKNKKKFDVPNGYLQMKLPSEDEGQEEVIRLTSEGKESKNVICDKVLQASFPEWVSAWEYEKGDSKAADAERPRWTRPGGPVVQGSFEALEGQREKKKASKQRDVDLLSSIVTEPLDQYPVSMGF